MTTNGRVRNLDALIPIGIEDRDGTQHSYQVVIDTGFDGTLSLPLADIERLGLREGDARIFELANGREYLSRTFNAVVHWDGGRYEVVVNEMGKRPLLGMELLSGRRVTLDVVEDGPVTVERLGAAPGPLTADG